MPFAKDEKKIQEIIKNKNQKNKKTS
jgi:hypothetical protein